jgi:hypothetical protein
MYHYMYPPGIYRRDRTELNDSGLFGVYTYISLHKNHWKVQFEGYYIVVNVCTRHEDLGNN